MKLRCSFFPKENLIRRSYIFPHYVRILFIHSILLSKELLHIPQITPQNAKNTSQFLNIFKKDFRLWRDKRLTTLGILITK